MWAYIRYLTRLVVEHVTESAFFRFSKDLIAALEFQMLFYVVVCQKKASLFKVLDVSIELKILRGDFIFPFPEFTRGFLIWLWILLIYKICISKICHCTLYFSRWVAVIWRFWTYCRVYFFMIGLDKSCFYLGDGGTDLLNYSSMQLKTNQFICESVVIRMYEPTFRQTTPLQSLRNMQKGCTSVMIVF